ncbi:MAG: glycosyltransferase family 39 protein [Chloroflexi bacterium]|nr:glycosyltransferase family 39 protein [Chloroflexota bacterium]
MKGNARYALVVFMVALLLRLGYLAWRWPLLPDWNVDATGYHQLAVNLVQRGIFSLNTEPPFHPDAIRTPGYPLFIAAVYVLTGISPRAVLVVQAVLDAVTALLVMGISRNLGLPKGIAAVTGLLYALSPLAWRYSAELYVESILAFAVAVMFWLLSRPSMRPGWAGILGLGVACGVTLLVKPNMVLLPVILAIALLIRSGLRQTLLFVLATGLVLMPWVIRNALVFGRPMLSTVFENNLARVSAPATLAEASGEEVAPWTPRWEALFFEVVDRATRTNPQLFATPVDAMDPRESDQATLALADTAREIIANHPAAFVASHVKGVLHGLLPGEYRFWFGQFSGQTWESAMPAGIAGAIRARGWQAVPLLALILFVASVAVTVASGVAMSVGWWRLVRRHVIIASAMGAFILYVLLLPGPIAYERFQVPAVPLVAVLIGCAFEPETHKTDNGTL